MKKMKYLVGVSSLLMCLLLLVSPVAAQGIPLIPHAFYGHLTIGGQAAPVGTVVTAKVDGVDSGSIVTTEANEYGSSTDPTRRLIVQGEAINNGDTIEFYINDAKADQSYTFTSGATTRLDISIASAPPPPAVSPASFSVSYLAISPADVKPGERVTIQVEATNSGSSQGTYTVTLKVNNVTEATKDITLAPGEGQTVSFTIAKETTGSYMVQLDGLQGTFIVTGSAEPAPPGAPANFIVSDLSITPETVEADSKVTITAKVTNSGGSQGSYKVSLKINDAVIETRDITLAAGETQTVEFTVSKRLSGNYSVAINGLKGEFTVTEAPAPPPPTPPPPAPPPEIKPPVNWPVVGGIIAGVAVVGLLIFFLVRRRAY